LKIKSPSQDLNPDVLLIYGAVLTKENLAKRKMEMQFKISSCLVEAAARIILFLD